LSIGKGPIGFVNPVLYANPHILNDITNGTNVGCGSEGFSAIEGCVYTCFFYESKLTHEKMGPGNWFGHAQLPEDERAVFGSSLDHENYSLVGTLCEKILHPMHKEIGGIPAYVNLRTTHSTLCSSCRVSLLTPAPKRLLLCISLSLISITYMYMRGCFNANGTTRDTLQMHRILQTITLL
jgi:hypothetical protein